MYIYIVSCMAIVELSELSFTRIIILASVFFLFRFFFVRMYFVYNVRRKAHKIPFKKDKNQTPKKIILITKFID